MALLIVVILLRHPCVVVVYCDRSSAIRAFKIDYTILSAHRHSDGKKEDRTTTARRRMNSSPGECCANAYNIMLKQYVSHDHPKAPHCMATMTMRVPQNDSSNKREEQKKKTTHTPYEKKTTKTTSEIIMHMHAYKACTAQRYMLPLQSVSVCVLRCCWTSSFAMHFWSLHVYEGEKRADWIAITNSSRRNIIVHIFRIRAVLDFGPVHENVVHGRGRQAEDNVCLCVGTGNEQDTLDRQPDTYTTNQKKNTGPSHTRRKKGLEAAI